MIDRTEIPLRAGTNGWIPGLAIAIAVSLAIIVACMAYVIIRDLPAESGKKASSRSTVVFTISIISFIAALLSGMAVYLIWSAGPKPGEYGENNQYIAVGGYDWHGRYTVMDTGSIMDATGVPVHIHAGRDADIPSPGKGSVIMDWIDAEGTPHKDGRIMYNGNGTISMYDSEGDPIHKQDGSALKAASTPMGGDWPGYMYENSDQGCQGEGLPAWVQRKYGIKDTWAHGHGFGDIGEAFSVKEFKSESSNVDCKVTVFTTRPPFPDSTVDAGHVRMGNLLRKRWIMEFGGRIYTMPYDGHGGVLSE